MDDRKMQVVRLKLANGKAVTYTGRVQMVEGDRVVDMEMQDMELPPGMSWDKLERPTKNSSPWD